MICPWNSTPRLTRRFRSWRVWCLESAHSTASAFYDSLQTLLANFIKFLCRNFEFSEFPEFFQVYDTQVFVDINKLRISSIDKWHFPEFYWRENWDFGALREFLVITDFVLKVRFREFEKKMLRYIQLHYSKALLLQACM